jgi:hypothetical protein
MKNREQERGWQVAVKTKALAKLDFNSMCLKFLSDVRLYDMNNVNL